MGRLAGVGTALSWPYSCILGCGLRALGPCSIAFNALSEKRVGCNRDRTANLRFSTLFGSWERIDRYPSLAALEVRLSV